MKKSLLIFLFSILGASACVDLQANTVTTETGDHNCIPPLTAFAYPLYSKEKSDVIDQDRVLPMSPWGLVTDLPNNGIGSSGYGSILFARSMNGVDEIWILGQNEFLIFYPDTKSWELIDGQIKGEGKIPRGVFLASSGSIWGVGMMDWEDKKIPILSRYNENENFFEFVSDSESSHISSVAAIGLPVEDAFGRFWMIINHNELYGFNPTTMKSHFYVDTSLSLLSPQIAIAPNAKIYILSIGLEKSELIQYDPEIEAATNIPILLHNTEGLPFNSLFLDQSGRLWFHDYGWLDSNGNWYKVVRTPLFISDKTEYQFQYLWENPDIVLESSNGLLWFKSSMGLTWLNPQNGEWCRVTSYPATIAEDQKHNLWMLADGKLYKYPLNP